MTEEIEKQAEEYLKQDGTNGEKALSEILKKYPNPIEVKDKEEMKNVLNLLCNYPKEVWKDGVKWGMEHAIEWHDLKSHVLPKREISKKYMPKANEKVMLKYHFYNETEIHFSDGYYDMFDFEFHIPNNPTGRIICVIAWCELPTYKE